MKSLTAEGAELFAEDAENALTTKDTAEVFAEDADKALTTKDTKEGSLVESLESLRY